MRALCGAIITAGALIGMGLAAIGIGNRYANEKYYVADSSQPVVKMITQMDHPMVYILMFLTVVAIIGLGIAFVGLAYHHARREREHAWQRHRMAAQQRTTV
jgi:F0F1-type ATP synthase membrane subunit c/vacuolar-type H+-ATPase subunit K